jgi:hypothetical protein
MAHNDGSSVKDKVTHREIDWASAEVRDGALSVTLTGSASDEWRNRLEAILSRLDHSGNPWGRIHPTKRRVKVDGLAEGDEDRLRHFLEAAIQQTNADLAAPDPEPVDGGSDADQRMTEAFRACGDSPAEA